MPLQSAICTFTGSTCPFFSLFVTGWLVMGAMNEAVPTLTVVLFVSEPPSSSLTLTVTVLLQPAVAKVCVCVCPVVNGFTVCAAVPSFS